MTRDALIAYLRGQVQVYGSQRALAHYCGVSAAYISDILNGRREPGESVLRALGFRKVVRYERILQTED
jgi:transcriptional regulator with XRE-family HTH domain